MDTPVNNEEPEQRAPETVNDSASSLTQPFSFMEGMPSVDRLGPDLPQGTFRPSDRSLNEDPDAGRAIIF